MSIHINIPGNTPAGYRSDISAAGQLPVPNDRSQTGTGTVRPAFVTEIDPGSLAKSLSDEDAPLSDGELKQLFTVYRTLGRENKLWKEIGSLLTEMSGNDRTNFLSVLSRSDDNMEDFVTQVAGLEAGDRSAYLSTAVRLDPEEGLSGLIQSVDHLDDESLTSFLDVADQLGRSRRSLKAGELKNFVMAAAGAPEDIDALVKKASELEKEDRELFLRAASSAGRELEQLIATADSLSGKDLTLFLSAASKAGKGLSNLLDMTGTMDEAERERMMAFIEDLSEKAAENFLLATQGAETNGFKLMGAAGGMSGREQEQFFALGAEAGIDLGRLITLVNSLPAGSGELSDFLSIGVTAEGRLGDVLSLVDNMAGEGRREVLSFASELDLVDMNSFLTAVKDRPGTADDLAKTARDLEGRDRSYLLYAASLHSEMIPELTEMARDLSDQDLFNFLFLAANTGDPEEMKGFLSRVGDAAGHVRTELLAQQREQVMESGENRLGREYVFLKSTYTGNRFDTLISAGDDIDRFVTEVAAMDSYQREAFFDLAGAAGKENLDVLLSVTSQLDEEQTRDFMDLSKTLGRTGKKDLVVAADLAFDGTESGTKTFERLLETAGRLGVSSDEQFLHAAAASGKSLGKFIDLTDQLSGMNQVNFLVAAFRSADVDDGGQLLKTHIETTDYLLNSTPYRYEPIRPSQIINTGTGVFMGTPNGYSGGLSAFLESAAFLAGEPDVRYGDRMNWYNSFMGIPASDKY